MADDVPWYVARFRLLYVFNAWALSIAAAVLLPIGVAIGAGGFAAVPGWLWLVPVVDGGAFALYFLLSGAVAEYYEDAERSLPGPLERIGATLSDWDEAGRSTE